MHGEAGGGEGDPGVEDWGEVEGAVWGDVGKVGEGEGKEAADGPGEGRVEDKAGLAGVVGGGVGPVRMEVAVGELPGSFEPAEEVEGEVVTAGGTVAEEGGDGDEARHGNEEEVKAVAARGHG